MKTRKPLPTLADVAREAGVSTATADRVIHRRPGVRAATVDRVLQAAASLAYLPEADLRAALTPPPLRIAFLLPSGPNRYLRMLGDTVGFAADHWAPFNVRCQAFTVESFDAQALARALLHHAPRVDGIAMMAIEHPAVREAVATLDARGVPVVTIISDLANSKRAAFIGLDNRAAGRTAAWLLGRFIGPRAAKVALIAGSRSYGAHEEREAGFLHLIDEQFPALDVVGLREGHDDPERNYRQTRTLLKQHPALAGIYNIGGSSDGVARALKEAGRADHVVLIGHGLTPDTRALLIDGSLDAVITQSPHAAVLACVRVFANLRERRDPMAGIEATRSQVIFRENLP